MRFFTALAFLTTLPTPRQDKVGAEDYARSVPYFPLVGLLLGLILAGLDFVLRLAFQPLVVSALLVAVMLILTGALHFEGFVDACDGLFSAKPPEKRLEIMKDSRVGAFGVAGAGALLLLKFAALAALPTEIRPQALILTPILTRWSMAYAMTAFPYGRQGPGVGKIFVDYLRPRDTIYATIIALLASILIGRLAGVAALLVAAATTWLLARYSLSRIPGLTGDVYGAINEVGEAVILLMLPSIVALLAQSI